MSQRIYFGTNLNFARYVWGTEAALDIVRRQLGLRAAEPVADNDFGPALYLRNRDAFIRHHQQIGRYAREQGIFLSSVFTFYRDGGAVGHPDPDIRQAAADVLESVAVQASAAGAPYACAALMTAHREDFAADPVGCRERAWDAWAVWMRTAHHLELRGVLVEMSAQPREDCATIAQTAETLGWLRRYHENNPGDTVPVGLCYDLGHGISEAEAPDSRERDFRAWFEAFPDDILEVHLKNTDPDFQATWPFTPDYASAGIINPNAVVAGVRDLLRQDVYLMLEVAGKRGREIGETTILRDLKVSVEIWERALEAGGYSQNADGSWVLTRQPDHGDRETQRILRERADQEHKS